jgi:hypothetical protein
MATFVRAEKRRRVVVVDQKVSLTNTAVASLD